MTTNAKQPPHTHPEWQGYTIDELRYQRALTSARLEIQKERLLNQYAAIRGNFGSLKPTGIYGKIFNSLSFIDYGVLAFRTIRRVTGIIRSFRRH